MHAAESLNENIPQLKSLVPSESRSQHTVEGVFLCLKIKTFLLVKMSNLRYRLNVLLLINLES